MKKTPCDTIFASESNFEGQMINTIVNCLALEHRRFNDALMTLGAASASLASDPLNSKFHERATQAWSSLKTPWCYGGAGFSSLADLILSESCRVSSARFGSS